MRKIIDIKNLFYILILVIISFCFGYILVDTNKEWKERFTIRANYDFFQPISDRQRFDIYRDRMEKFRIAYSPVYKFRGRKRSLSNEEFEKFSRLSFRIESFLHHPYGTYISIAIVETDLIAKQTGLYSECGLFQIMASNVDYIQWLWYKYKSVLPGWMNPVLYDENCFFDIEKAMKSAALILYHGQQVYNNNWKWIVTDYHYGGGYTQRYWDIKNVEGELSLTITLNDITYIVTDYWQMWATLQEAFVNNKITAGDEKIKTLIRTKKKRLTKAQEELKKYFSLYKTLKKFERQVENSEHRSKESAKEANDLKKRVRKALLLTEKGKKTQGNKAWAKLIDRIKKALYEKK